MAFNLGSGKMSFADLKKMAPKDRVNLLNNSQRSGAASPFTLLTPAEFAELFPKYYMKGLPDVGGFREALSRKKGGGSSGGGSAGGEPDTSGYGSSVTNTVQAKKVYDYLRSKGVDHNHAVGMVTNMRFESNFNAGVIGDHGTSGGLFQHHADRFRNMVKFVGADWRTNPDSWKKQIDFALTESDTKRYLSTSYETPKAATAGFTRQFERPANTEGEAAKRAASADGYSKSVQSSGTETTQKLETAKPEPHKKGENDTTKPTGKVEVNTHPDRHHQRHGALDVTPQKIAQAPQAPSAHVQDFPQQTASLDKPEAKKKEKLQTASADVSKMSSADFLMARQKQKDANKSQTAQADRGAQYADAGNVMNDAGVTANVDYETKRNAVLREAKGLGIDPHHLMTTMLFESIGSLDPNKQGKRDTRRGAKAAQKQGAHDKYLGLIQFGSTEQLKYGVKKGQSFDEHMVAVGKYLKDRGIAEWMKKHPDATEQEKLTALYSTINAGGPDKKHWGKNDARQGGARTTVAQKAQQMMRDWSHKAEQFVGKEEGAKLAKVEASKTGTAPAAAKTDYKDIAWKPPEELQKQEQKAKEAPVVEPTKVAAAEKPAEPPKPEPSMLDKAKEKATKAYEATKEALNISSPKSEAETKPAPTAPVTPPAPVAPPAPKPIPAGAMDPMPIENKASPLSDVTKNPDITNVKTPGASKGGAFDVGDKNIQFYPMDKKDNMAAVDVKTQKPLFTARTDEKVSVDSQANRIDVAPKKRNAPPIDAADKMTDLRADIDTLFNMTTEMGKAKEPPPVPVEKPATLQSPVLIDSFQKQHTTGFSSPSLERAMNKTRGRESDQSANRINNGTSIA